MQKFKKFIKKFKIFIKSFQLVLTVLGLIPLSIILIVLITYLTIPFSDIKKLKNDFVKVEVENNHVQYSLVAKRPIHWIALEKISKYAVSAIVLSEDSTFYQHSGVDYIQLQEAINDGLKKERPMRGASTITQQMVKNLFLTNERSLWRKLREYFITFEVERNLDKKKILEIYLNIIEYGPNVYGISRAAHYYFKKSAESLIPREAAFLAMLLPNPKSYSQSFRQQRLTKFAHKSIIHVLTKMKRAGILSKENFLENLYHPFAWEKYEIQNQQSSNSSKLTIEGQEVDSSITAEDSDEEVSEEALEELAKKESEITGSEILEGEQEELPVKKSEERTDSTQNENFENHILEN